MHTYTEFQSYFLSLFISSSLTGHVIKASGHSLGPIQEPWQKNE